MRLSVTCRKLLIKLSVHATKIPYSPDRLLMNSRIIVIDFETTGLSANNGDRVIEVGAVALENGQIAERFQSLINPGMRINTFIESYTGISNQMLETAPAADSVMPDLHGFIADSPLMAHNASFDRGFLDVELARLGLSRKQPFVCTMRMARRLYPNSPNHKLGTLVEYTNIPQCGQFHRALADAEMTGLLWLAMEDLLRSKFNIASVDLELMQEIEALTIRTAEQCLFAKQRVNSPRPLR